MSEPIIQVSHLTYYYPFAETPALCDVNLEIHSGEFVLIAGPSGCGKSTLALSLNGIIPTVLGGRIKGLVRVDSLDTRRSPVYELGTKIGVVFQDPDSQLCNLSVGEEIAFGPANLLVEKDEIRARVRTSLDDVGEAGINGRLIHELSGGQKQRVAIASILAMQPKIMLLDEPSTNLDPTGVVQLFELLERLNREKGMTIVVIEHNLAAVVEHADRMIVMDQGGVRLEGDPRDLLDTEAETIFRTLGLRIPQVSELALGFRERGIEISPFPLSVEEAFEGISGRHDQMTLGAVKRLDPRPEQSDVIIETEGLGFIFPDGTHAVKDVSLKIAKGEVVGIAGRNGSGKTSLTSLLVGLKKPSYGAGSVCGLDLAQATTRTLTEKVGYVFQNPEHQFVETTVAKEVAFGLRARKRPQAEIEERVEHILELMGLEEMRERHPFRLSMGEKRRLSVASMLILNPEVIILDEPTTGQDRRNIDLIMKSMREANQRGVTVLMITQNTNLLFKYCSRIVVMEGGELVFNGTRRELWQDHEAIRSEAMVLPQICRLRDLLSGGNVSDSDATYTVDELLGAARLKACLDSST